MGFISPALNITLPLEASICRGISKTHSLTDASNGRLVSLYLNRLGPRLAEVHRLQCHRHLLLYLNFYRDVFVITDEDV